MIEFPQTIRPQDVTPALVDYGSLTRPIFGGEILRTNRPGNRFQLAVTLPPIPAAQGSGVLSDLIRGKQEGLRMLWEQGLKITPNGSPVIDGAAQSGTSLAIRGLRENTKILKDMFFSFEQDGKSRLHIVTAEAIAAANGTATLSIEPELRVSTTDGAALSFTAPVIDGFVMGDSWEWSLNLAHHLEISFELIERY